MKAVMFAILNKEDFTESFIGETMVEIAEIGYLLYTSVSQNPHRAMGEASQAGAPSCLSFLGVHHRWNSSGPMALSRFRRTFPLDWWAC
jgi:hypothetical protein